MVAPVAPAREREFTACLNSRILLVAPVAPAREREALYKIAGAAAAAGRSRRSRKGA